MDVAEGTIGSPCRHGRDFFYSDLLQKGEGALDLQGAEEPFEDAVSDHNEIADAVVATARLTVGSDEWWATVDLCNTLKKNSRGCCAIPMGDCVKC